MWARAQSKDPHAYADIFDLHSARVYRRALGILGNVHDAEDVTAAAFFELWRKHRAVRLVGGSVSAASAVVLNSTHAGNA